MLPVAIRVNLEVCQAEFARLSHLLFGRNPKTPAEAAEAFLAEIEKLCDRVGVPRRLSQVGVTPRADPRDRAEFARRSMSGNPRELSDAELTAILEGLL